MDQTITSAENPLIKKARKVLAGSRRAFPGLCAAEGIKVVREVLEASVLFETAIITERLSAHIEGRELHQHLAARGVPIVIISQGLMAALSEVGAHQGILALVHRPTWSEADLIPSGTPWLMVLSGVQDPGNLGTILRTGEAAGISGAITGAGAVDPFNAKSIRASMGSVFRLPLQTHWTVEQTLSFLQRNRIRTIATAGRQGVLYTEVDLTGPIALILGGEGHGLAPDLFQAADMRVHIPMSARVESLNVAVCAAILIYETHRQRRRISP